MKKISATLLSLALAGSALAGCASDRGEVPQPKANTAAHVATSPDRFAKIQTTIFSVLAEADSALDAAKLSERATGPMAQMRAANYSLKSLLADSYALQALSTTATSTAISSASGFPRVAVSIMAPVQGVNLQGIDVFAQNSARENWKLWSNLSILPGATVPAILSGKEGAQIVANDSKEGLAATPNEAIQAYVALNQTRSDANGLTFADDAVRKAFVSFQDGTSSAIGDAGVVTTTFAAGESAPIAIRTDDGGALVFGQINYTSTVAMNKGRKVTISTNPAHLAMGAADGKVSLDGNSLVTNYSVVVAIYVPAEGAADQTFKAVAAAEAAIISSAVQ